MTPVNDTALALDAGAIEKILEDLISRIAADFSGDRAERLALIGIQTRGAILAERIRDALKTRRDAVIPLGKLDISMYRDDIGLRKNLTLIKETHIPFDVNGREILLVDDVLFTGRTIRAALDAITDYGRPALIRLAVLIDRGCREFPIQPDYAGVRLEVPQDKRVYAALREIDGTEAIYIDTRKRSY